MKKYILALVSAIALSGCSTFNLNPTGVSREVNKDYHVVAEICMPNPENREFIVGNTTERNDEIVSSGGYEAPLRATTVDNMSIYSGRLAQAYRLTYMTVNTTSLAVFKRDFTKYNVNEWSAWESADYAVQEGTGAQNSFFWLSTRQIDRTNELKKVPTPPNIKVRFKLTSFEDYLKTVKPRVEQHNAIEKNVPSCLKT